MGGDNSLEINIEAIDDASDVMEGVAEAASEMAGSIQDTAQGVNGALQSMSESVTELNNVMGVDSASITEDALAVGVSFDDAASVVLASNEEMSNSAGSTAESVAAATEYLGTSMGAAAVESMAAAGEIDSSLTGIGGTSQLQAGIIGAALLMVSQQFKRLAGDVTGEISAASDATEKWALGNNELAQILKNTGSTIPIAELIAFTKEMQATTLFQQQDVLASENMVMAHKNMAPNYREIIGLSADLATKMALTTGGTANLENATRLLTNAMTDPVTALMLLKQANVDLDPAVIKSITTTAKAGDSAAASALLIKSLESSVGGLAQTADKTSGTGMKKLGNDMESMQQNMPGVTSAMDELAGALEKLLKPLAEFVDKHPTLTANVLLAAAAIFSILGAVTGFAAQLIILKLALAPVITYVAEVGLGAVLMAGFWAIAIAAVIALVVLLVVEIVKHWSTIKVAWNDLVDALKYTWNAVIDYLSDKFLEWYNKIMGWINSVIDSLKNIAHSIGSGVSSVITTVGHIIGVQDAIISPGGNIITTDPADYLIATKNPGSLMGGGQGTSGSGGITVYITGQVYSTQDQAKIFGDAIARQINRQLKLTTFR